MRIFDNKNFQVDQPDLQKGRLKRDRIFVKHHEAVEEVPEEGHWETVKEYQNGGKDVAWVVDVQGVQAKEAWDEQEDILRYVEYADDDLSLNDRVRLLERQMTEIIQLLTKNGGE